MNKVTRTRTSPDQKDKGLGFDGMSNGSSQGHTKNRFAGNQHGGAAEGNFGRGPTVGNMGCGDVGPKKPPYSAVPTLPAQGSVRDSINRGKQERNPSGTRAFAPSATQNYKGNIDSINSGRGPTKGNSQ